MSTSASPSSLSLQGIRKRFGKTIALAGADLTVRAGSLHALLGANGAGKTTLMRIAFGMVQADAGSVLVDGVVRRFRSSADAIAAGIGMVHQNFLLVDEMTVAENVALGDVASRGFFQPFDSRAVDRQVRLLGEETGLLLDPLVRAGSLPVGAQQRLELLKALARRARLLVLDEPASVLAPAEAADLNRWLRGFVARGGTVVLVTHKLREALELADDVTVLRHGRAVLSGPAAGMREEDVVRALLGDRAESATRVGDDVPLPVGDVVLRLDGVSVVDVAGITRVRGVTLDVHAGEIVGVVGVEGSGQRELLRVLAGRLAATTGRLRLPSAVGFVPEDRLRDALIPELSLVDNAALVGAGAARGRIPWREVTRQVEQFIEAFEVAAPGPSTRVDELSGGNQQKFLLARELSAARDALVAENPTRGLDILATEHVRTEIRRAARENRTAVVFYSSDLDEVLGMADRVVVCYAGGVRELNTASPAAIAAAMVGVE